MLARGRPDGWILAQVAAGLSVPPLRFRSHFKFCAGRPCVTWPYPVFPISPPRARASPNRLPVPVARNWSESTMTALRCFLWVLVRRCQARSCLFQNLAPTAAVLCLLRPFWIRLAWPVRWTNTQVRETLSIFNPTISGSQAGGHSRSLTRCRRFPPASAPATPAARPGLKYTKHSDFSGED